MTTRTRTRLLGLAAAATLLTAMTACGSDDQGGAATTAALPATSAPPTTLAASTTAVPGSSTPPTDAPTTTEASGPSQELIDAAEKEGQVVWYTADTEGVANHVIEAFEKEYDIDVQLFRANTGELLQRFTAEVDAGTPSADVISNTDSVFFSTRGEKYLMPFDESLLPSADVYSRDFTHALGAATQIVPYAVAYNTDLVAESDLPTTWEDLITPEWKDRIYLLDPRTVSAVSIQAFYVFLLDTYGEGYMTALAANGIEFVGDAAVGTQQLAAGGRDVMFPSNFSNVNPLKAKGAPINVTIFDETTGPQVILGQVKGSAHPNAAKLFQMWLFSEAGQTALTGFAGGVSPLNADIEGALPAPSAFVQSDIANAPTRIADVIKALGL